MPPVPLRPLIQPWDDISEEDVEVYGDGYDGYDEYTHSHLQGHHHQHQHHESIGRPSMSHDEREENMDMENEDLGDDYDEDEQSTVRRRIDEPHATISAMAVDLRLGKEGAPSDPYALDAPIDLSIGRAELEGLEMDDSNYSTTTNRYDLL
ncbi:hypothetical protein BGX29_003102 [Mortierella sp. GBA35]|nr:hypothetical protein BGX29_003102 [Mortierella sp. GBA35]